MHQYLPSCCPYPSSRRLHLHRPLKSNPTHLCRPRAPHRPTWHSLDLRVKVEHQSFPLSQQTPRVQSRGLTTKGILRHDGIHTDLPRGDRSACPQGLLHHLPRPVIPRLALHRRLDGGQRVVAMPGRLGVRAGIAAAEYDRQIPPSVRRQFDLVGGSEGEERRPPSGLGRLDEG